MIVRSDKKIHFKTAVCIGFFDGVHKGHQSLIEKIKSLGEKDIKTLIYTFDFHALEITGGKIRFIMPFEHKLEILKAQKTDYIYIQHMDREFMDISPSDFVSKILKDTLNAKYVVVGKNFLFGKNKSGDAEFLKKECKKFDIECHVMPYVKINDKQISSSAIREFISKGNVKLAHEYMCRPYTIKGVVIKGRQDGRKMGFPTANVISDDSQILPPNGVYATITYLGSKKYTSITNVGRAPTFGGAQTFVETNIFDFNKDIYGKKIKVEFLDRIRAEEKFSSIEKLKNQIQKDINTRKDMAHGGNK